MSSIPNSPAVLIADMLVGRLKALLSGVISTRRYSGYLDKDAVRTGKYVVVPAGEEFEGKRGVDHRVISIDVAWQIALPRPTEANKDPLENRVWIDEQMGRIEAIKRLFAAEAEVYDPITTQYTTVTQGPLRDYNFAGANFLRWSNSPLWRPDLMRDNSIFTSVVRLEFRLS
jgi:hypothetical protein